MRKTCSKCRTEKDETQFYQDGPHKTYAACKVCRAAAQAKRYRDDPTKVSNRRLQSTYGISHEEKVKMISDRKGLCDICKLPGNCVDHDHTTGQIRGILCRSCNLGLGKLGDNKQSILKVLAYLEGVQNA